MDDKTMLEWAARAAGIDHWYGKEGTVDWSPLHDDADALRLAVRLRLHVLIGDLVVTAIYDAGNSHSEFFTCDSAAETRRAIATRRAITRAAAEIGKGTGVG